jgi:two-component system, LuxR family, response regulator FixJ
MARFPDKNGGPLVSAQTPEEKAVVYVVDDDPAIHEYARWLLEGAGWRVETYDNPQLFLASFTDHRPACLVTDLRMPGASGLDLLHHLKERGVDLPIIVMTGEMELSGAEREMCAHAVDFIEKPFDGDELIKRVRTALSAKGAEGEKRKAEGGVLEP